MSLYIGSTKIPHVKVTTSSIYGNTYTVEEIASRSAPSGSVTLSNLTVLEDYALYGRTGITSILAPNITQVKVGSLQYCSNLESINVSALTTAGNYSFSNCAKLKTFNAPSLTTLGNYTFYQDLTLENLNINKVTTIPQSALRSISAKGLITNPITINDSSFRDDTNWGISYLPNLKTINGTYAMAGIFNAGRHPTVDSLALPNLTTLGGAANFSYNPTMVSCDIGNLTQIRSQTFNLNTTMDTLILRKSSAITTLENINAFSSTPFASNGTGGTLYVPQSLISTYQSATNWSTILGYTNNQIKSIESTHTDATAPIDLTLYYIDGTAI